MRLLPDRIFARIALLIAVVLFATLALAFASLRALSLQPGSVQIADLIAGQIVALRALERAGATPAPSARGDAVLDLRTRTGVPAHSVGARLAFLRRIEERLAERFGPGTRVRIESAPESRLWVQTPGADARWIGIAIPPFAQQASRLTFVVLGAATLLVLLASAWFAHSLARPLRRLAASAGAIARGDSEALDIPRNAPRELRTLAEALTEAGSQARRLARDRSLMLAGISHDLRTPLARLRLAIELDADSPGLELREGMVRDVEEIDSILSQFIDYARDGDAEPLAGTDLAALLCEVISNERTDAQDWSLAGVDAPCIRTVRPLALRRAVANLVRNAMLHGAPPYTLELICSGQDRAVTTSGDRASARRTRDDADCIVIRVADHGPGVDPALLSQLDQPFMRGNSARSGSGSGLGLAVASQVARLHRGQLQIDNREGGGLQVDLILRPE